MLVIPRECFFEVDLDKPIEIKRRFDLAISIEVAEHLSKNIAVEFIKTLTCASDIVLFSAAIPFQGGTNHINEQWPEYWNNIFKTYNYVAVDCMRKKFWANNEVLDFHKQNILLYVNKERLKELYVSENDICTDYPPMALITPDRYLRLIDREKKLIDKQFDLPYLMKRIIVSGTRKILGRILYEKLRLNIHRIFRK